MRKVEFGAGIAAVVLSVGALGMSLFAPLVAYCAVTVPAPATCPQVRYTSLVHAGLDAAVWVFLIGMLALTLVGAAGAIGEARFGVHRGAYALWAGAALVFAGCALTAGGIGLLYLPSVLALCLAAYASVARRMRSRTRTPSVAQDGSSAPDVSAAAQADPKAGA